MRTEGGPICCVVPDPGSLTALDTPPGREVVLLDCGAAPLRATGRVHCLKDIPIPAHSVIGQVHDCPVVDRSEQVRRALESLHEYYGFSEVHFTLLGGLAFRSLQAQRAGLAFGDVRLVVQPDSTSRQQREQRQSWPAGPDDLLLDYMEQYSSELALAAGRASQSKPLVTVGIAHYNLGKYLPAALKSIARQSYSNIEIIVVDDGSTDSESLSTLERLKGAYTNCRFLHQENAGIGATRNRLLTEARGEFFIPMDADNIAQPEMVGTFVRAMNRNPHLSAMTCYFLAFHDDKPQEFLYGYRPTGGPHVLSCIRNVYGDATGIFRTAEFRAVRGYETDRGTSCEDWEAYVKLVHAGKRIDVVPEYLFHYRHREAGFSRATNWFDNHQRVMRQFTDKNELWTALLGFQQQIEFLKEQQRRPRYRVADAVHEGIARPYRWLRRQLTQRS